MVASLGVVAIGAMVAAGVCSPSICSAPGLTRTASSGLAQLSFKVWCVMVKAVSSAQGEKESWSILTLCVENIYRPERQVSDNIWERGFGYYGEWISTSKTHNNLWYKIISFQNIYEAYIRARKGKRFQSEVLRFERSLEENIITLQNELVWKTWIPSRGSQFYVYEPKQRLITAPAFRDRVIHHSLVDIIEPFFERKFIDRSFACRVGKGTHSAHDCV